MNKQQAKVILLRHRPGTGDEQEADVREALAMAAQDPELARWLENHRQFQKTLTSTVRDVPIPAGLKEQILSERRAFFSLRRVPRRAAVAGALAAVLGLLITVTLIWQRGDDPEAQFATFRSRMVRAAQRGYAMHLESQSAEEVRKFLVARSAHGDWQSTPALEQQRLLGCATLKWRNEPAAMICYGREKEPELWLFVVDVKTLPNPPASEQPEFIAVNQLNTLSWTRAGKTYVLAGNVDETELRKLSDLGG